MKILKATMDQIDAIENLYEDCIRSLNRQGIFQWEESYPNRKTFEMSIANGSQYIMEDDGLIVGAVILNEDQALEWSKVAWHHLEEPIMAIHALAVSSEVQGRGYGHKLLEACEAMAKTLAYKAIRLDVFPDNKGAMHLYTTHGYKYRGAVHFNYKPVGHQEYHCYEKKLLYKPGLL